MKRIDIHLAEKGYFPSRNSAQASIMAGLVIVGGQIIDKPSHMVNEDAEIEVKEKPHYVSRGAFKLQKALDEFGIDVKSKVALDAGTSTGGFAQVLLERGIKKIIAVDVGYGQFHYKMRQDRRVRLYERTNIRYFDPKLVPPADLAVVDLSFISLTKVIDNVLAILKPKAELVLLIKPQFEAEPKLVKKGVVRDEAVHREILKKVLDFLLQHELQVFGLTFSPIKGPKGNIEFLVYLERQGKGITPAELDKIVSKTVAEAYHMLK